MIPFFFNDTATTEIYTLSLHDALPIWSQPARNPPPAGRGSHSWEAHCLRLSPSDWWRVGGRLANKDRKSTRLNSSHANISYAVFCLKKYTYFVLPTSPAVSMRVIHPTS